MAVDCGWQPGLVITPGVSPFGAVVVAEPPALRVPGDGLPLPAGAPPPLPPDLPGVWPPVSTLELTCTIACLNGGTASATLAAKMTPASTPIGRSQAMPNGRPGPGRGARCRGDGAGAAACGCSRNRGRGTALGLGSDSGQAQWPRQTQCLAWPKAPAATLTSQGCGWRALVRARIRSSPSAPGSTWPTAAHNARRSAPSRPFSGAVMPSPACPQRHEVSCSKIDLSAAIARAVWLLTAPLLIPIVAAISASERSA